MGGDTNARGCSFIPLDKPKKKKKTPHLMPPVGRPRVHLHLSQHHPNHFTPSASPPSAPPTVARREKLVPLPTWPRASTIRPSTCSSRRGGLGQHRLRPAPGKLLPPAGGSAAVTVVVERRQRRGSRRLRRELVEEGSHRGQVEVGDRGAGDACDQGSRSGPERRSPRLRARRGSSLSVKGCSFSFSHEHKIHCCW